MNYSLHDSPPSGSLIKLSLHATLLRPVESSHQCMMHMQLMVMLTPTFSKPCSKCDMATMSYTSIWFQSDAKMFHGMRFMELYGKIRCADPSAQKNHQLHKGHEKGRINGMCLSEDSTDETRSSNKMTDRCIQSMSLFTSTNFKTSLPPVMYSSPSIHMLHPIQNWCIHKYPQLTPWEWKKLLWSFSVRMEYGSAEHTWDMAFMRIVAAAGLRWLQPSLGWWVKVI